jgi:hypothetical protein
LRVFIIGRLMFRQSEEWWARTQSATTDAAEFCNPSPEDTPGARGVTTV